MKLTLSENENIFTRKNANNICMLLSLRQQISPNYSLFHLRICKGITQLWYMIRCYLCQASWESQDHGLVSSVLWVHTACFYPWSGRLTLGPMYDNHRKLPGSTSLAKWTIVHHIHCPHLSTQHELYLTVWYKYDVCTLIRYESKQNTEIKDSK